MKKLLALMIVGGLLGTLTGCPGATTGPTSSGGGTTPKPSATPTTAPPKATEATFDGKYVSFKEGKLSITVDDKPKDFTKVDIKPHVDGKEGKWDEIKEKATIKVVEKDGKVTKVEAKNPEAAAPPVVEAPKAVDGTFVSYDKEKGSITVKVGDAEKTFVVKDIKDVKFEDLKKDDKLSVTADKDGKATKVEKK